MEDSVCLLSMTYWSCLCSGSCDDFYSRQSIKLRRQSESCGHNAGKPVKLLTTAWGRDTKTGVGVYYESSQNFWEREKPREKGSVKTLML